MLFKIILHIVLDDLIVGLEQSNKENLVRDLRRKGDLTKETIVMEQLCRY